MNGRTPAPGGAAPAPRPTLRAHRAARAALHPWTSSDVHVPDVARLFDHTFRHRRALARAYPQVLLRCPRPLREGEAPFTGERFVVGALVHLWGRWPALRGRCPRCGGAVLGTAWNGMLANAHVFGVCRQCALAVRRFVDGGIGGLMGHVRRHLAGTGFGVGNPWGRAPHPERPYGELVAALQELGVAGLARTIGARPEGRP